MIGIIGKKLGMTQLFNAAGQQTNGEFGQYTAARPSRRIVFTFRALF